MASTLQIVSPSDTTDVLYDLNDSTGANNAAYGSVQTSILHNPDWGAPTLDAVRFESDTTGGQTPFHRWGLTQAQIPVRFKATTVDNLRAGLNRLSFLLSQGCTMKWLEDGSTVTRFVDIEPTTTPALLDGRELALWQAAVLVDYTQGITLQLMRQPFFYRDELDPALNLLVNSTLLGDGNLNGRPDQWAWDTTTNITDEAIASAFNCYQFDVSTGAVRDFFQTTPAGTAAEGDVWSFSFQAASPSATAKVRAVITYKDSAGATVGSEQLGTLTTLTSTFQTLTVTTSAAPANTDRVRATIRVDNDDATQRTFRVRYAQLEEAAAPTTFRVGPEFVVNDYSNSINLTRSVPFHNAGSAPAPVVTEIVADSGAQLTDVRVGLRSENGIEGSRGLTDYLNSRTGFLLQDASRYTDATLVADSAAAGDAVNVSFATRTDMVRRCRADISTELDALVGEYEVFVRLRPSNVSSTFKVQLKFSPSSADPAQVSFDPITFDTIGAATVGYVERSLGVVQVPSDIELGGLAFEVWAERTAGSGTLRFDSLAFVPADEALGSLRSGTSTSEQVWDADSLLTTASSMKTVSGDPTFTNATATGGGPQLDSINDICGIPASVTGTALSTGRAEFRVFWLSTTGTSLWDAVFRVVNTSTSTVVASDAFHFGTSGGATRGLAVAFNAVTGNNYQAQAFLTSTSGGRVTITAMSARLIPVVNGGEIMQADRDTYAVNKLDSAGVLAGSLAHTGQLPFVAPPGLSIVYLHFGDVPISGLAGTNTTLGRAPRVRFRYAPHEWM